MNQSSKVLGCEIVGGLLALAAIVIAALAWLAPFSPIGPSPIRFGSSQEKQVSSSSTPVVVTVVIVATATTMPQQPPTAIQLPSATVRLLPTATQVPPTGTPPPPTPTLAPVQSTATSAFVIWRHNPSLSAPQGYPGAISYTKRDFPGNSDRDWFYGVEISVNSDQILLIAGYAGNHSTLGQMGGTNHCFLLMTRGPFVSKIDLLSAGVETHEVTPNANTLIWATEKVIDLKSAYPSCTQGVDLWVGR